MSVVAPCLASWRNCKLDVPIELLVPLARPSVTAGESRYGMNAKRALPDDKAAIGATAGKCFKTVLC